MFNAINSITSAAVNRCSSWRVPSLKVFLSQNFSAKARCITENEEVVVGGGGGGDCPFQGVSFCQSTVRKFKKNRGHISLGSAYCRTFLGRFFPPNALRPDLYLLLSLTYAENIRTFSFIYSLRHGFVFSCSITLVSAHSSSKILLIGMKNNCQEWCLVLQRKDSS